MNVRRWMIGAAVVVAAVVLKTVPAVAHHSSAPFYDDSKKIDLQGSVTRFAFKNPHSFLYIEVADDKGEKAEWQIELGAAAGLTRTGWTPDTLKPGLVIKVSGPASRAEGSHGVLGRRITRADGSPIVAGGRVTEIEPPK